MVVEKSATRSLRNQEHVVFLWPFVVLSWETGRRVPALRAWPRPLEQALGSAVGMAKTPGAGFGERCGHGRDPWSRLWGAPRCRRRFRSQSWLDGPNALSSTLDTSGPVHLSFEPRIVARSAPCGFRTECILPCLMAHCVSQVVLPHGELRKTAAQGVEDNGKISYTPLILGAEVDWWRSLTWRGSEEPGMCCFRWLLLKR